jgi:hypothetical protein
MQEKGIWLCNDYVRIKNPIANSNEENIFIGSASMYDFKNFTKKFDMLKESLLPFDIYFTKIYVGETAFGTSFLVETNSAVIWVKKASNPNSRSPNNFLYIGRNKVKLSKWLTLSYEKRSLFINYIN